MSDKKKAFQVSIDIVTHAKMVKHSKNSYRTVRKQLEHDLKELYKNIDLSVDDMRLVNLSANDVKDYPNLVAKFNSLSTGFSPATGLNDDDEEELL
jgi:hypothetical protein